MKQNLMNISDQNTHHYLIILRGINLSPGRGRHLFNVRTLIKERTLVKGRCTLI